MATIEVRVTPRASRPGLEAGAAGVIARVRAAPEGGRANDEAARILAAALDVAPSRVHLRAGSRSRRKVFEVDGLDRREVDRRLAELPNAR